MSQPTRTLADIQQEFARHCAQAGQIQYQIAEANRDLGLVNNRLRDLNLEAQKVKEAEAIAKEAVAKEAVAKEAVAKAAAAAEGAKS